MPDNKPRSRERNVTGQGTGGFKTGSGLGTGPVGSTGGTSGGGGHSGGSGGGGHRAARAGGGGLGLLVIIAIAYFLFGRGGSSEITYYDDGAYENAVVQDGAGSLSALSGNDGSGSSAASSGGSVSSLISALTTGSYGDSDIYTSSSYDSAGFESSPAALAADSGNSLINMDVATGARAKRTVINGDGSDVVTIMVYMCGTDLESKSGMASNDMAEMAQASISDNVNVIVYTGGCKGWKTQGISNKVNQIYQIKNGGLKRLVEDDGNKAMTDPATLAGFIKYCSANFPANRNELIFWDHGGGSVSGYGYDEKNAYGGSMDLAGIDKALKAGGVTFDFIGFDACLMATAETALMLDDYADYMIASEETEPGIGWYYTNWMTALSGDTGMSTLNMGKSIIDDFNQACAYKCPGQKTTLSIVDLAEFADTVPANLSAFAKSISSLISDKSFKEVSDARYNTREFAQNSRIDQVDLIDLCQNVGNSEGKALAEAVRSSVKYNRTSSNISRANGVSIYFPYQKKSMANQAVSTFKQIGMNEDYIRCVTDAASMQTAGQVAGGGGYDLLSALGGAGSSGYSYSGGSADMIGTLLGAFLSDRSIPGSDDLDRSNTAFYDDRSFTDEDAAEFISLNSFDAGNLFWSDGTEGEKRLKLSSEQWKLIHDVDLNMFIDDGAGYIDLGLDNVFTFDGDELIADDSHAWIGIGTQIAPYYHTDTIESGDEYSINGYIPVLYNNERAKLIVIFDNENPHGYIAGVDTDYRNNETETAAKSTVGLNVGDTIQLMCDYYTYDFEYSDSYKFGNPITVTEDMTVTDVDVSDYDTIITYRLTDIYNRAYWTPVIK
ncbi:MAG: peptidase C11 [Lachnospiraceae bacterium]|nr:peptidase C11 [Lachnospiraceae bacterium]